MKDTPLLDWTPAALNLVEELTSTKFAARPDATPVSLRVPAELPVATLPVLAPAREEAVLTSALPDPSSTNPPFQKDSRCLSGRVSRSDEHSTVPAGEGAGNTGGCHDAGLTTLGQEVARVAPPMLGAVAEPSAAQRVAIPNPPFQKHSETSKAAADAIKECRGPMHRAILDSLEGTTGATDEEMQKVLALKESTQRPRRRELQLAGYIEDSGHTRLTESGRAAVVWRIVVATPQTAPHRGCCGAGEGTNE